MGGFMPERETNGLTTARMKSLEMPPKEGRMEFTTDTLSTERQTTPGTRQLVAPSATPSMYPTVSVVVPALNEADNLPHVLDRIPEWVH